MAKPAHAPETTERDIYPAHGDPIRVVPLNLPQELIGEKAAPAAAPHLTYRNGQRIQNVEVFIIFWGTGWEKAPASNLISQVNDFFSYILTSSRIDQLAEYNVQGQSIGHRSFTGTISITTPQPHRSVSDTAIQHMLQNRSQPIHRSRNPDRAPFTLSTCNPERKLFRVAEPPARYSADITTTSPAGSSMRSCRIRDVQVARAV